MRKVALIGWFLGLMLTAGPLSADEITVLKPAAGTFNAGALMEIQWTYTFLEWTPANAAQRQMVISIHQYGKDYGLRPVPGTSSVEIATVNLDTLKYAWRVPNYTSNWDGFILRLEMKERPSIYAYSPPFEIRKGPVVKPPLPVGLKTIIPITSPTAGQSYKIGSTMPIRWDKEKIKGYGSVWLQVCWPDHTADWGSFPTSNTGSYDWKIAETAENTLCIKIYTQDEKCVGYSGNFKIIK